VGADVVIGFYFIGGSANDENRIVGDVVGDVVADLGDFLDAAGLLPHLGPQPIGLRLCIISRDIRFDRVGQRLG
jgi:hypothetical protein